MSTETEGFEPDPTESQLPDGADASADTTADASEREAAPIGGSPAEHLETVATQTPEATPADAHATSVALAHESFKRRIENAYSELKTSLDNAWSVYLKDRGIEKLGSEALTDLGEVDAERGDATTAR